MRRRIALASAGALILLSLSCGLRTAKLEFYDSHVVGVGDKATWSPDGKSIAFLNREYVRPQWGPPPAKGHGAELLVTKAEGGEPARVLTPGFRVEDFQWSPDSRSIAFLADELGAVSANDGSALRTLTSGAHARSFEWSPDSRELLYDAHNRRAVEYNRHGLAVGPDSVDLHVVDVGSGEARIVRRSYPWKYPLLCRYQWLADGNIALQEWPEPGAWPHWTVIDRFGGTSPKVTSHEKLTWQTGLPPATATWMMMNADGTDTVRPGGPDWRSYCSNAAKRMARVEYDSAGSHIVVTDTLGRHRRTVADSADSPRWLSDGKWLVYTERFGKDWYSPSQRLVVSADGKYRREVPEAVTLAPTGDRVFRMVGDSIVVSRIRVRVVRGSAGAPPDWRM